MGDPGSRQGVLDGQVIGTIKDRCEHSEAQCLSCPTEMGLQNLTDVHSGRDTNRVEDNINRCAIGQEGHILFGGNEGNDTLIAMTSGQLITYGDLSFLGNPYLNPFIDPGGQVVTAIPTGVYSHIDNLAPLTVWNAQRGIFHIAGLLTENRPQ